LIFGQSGLISLHPRANEPIQFLRHTAQLQVVMLHFKGWKNIAVADAHFKKIYSTPRQLIIAHSLCEALSSLLLQSAQHISLPIQLSAGRYRLQCSHTQIIDH
jgi:hypothetical protein